MNSGLKLWLLIQYSLYLTMMVILLKSKLPSLVCKGLRSHYSILTTGKKLNKLKNQQLFFFYFILFICFFWPCWVFAAARGLSLVAASGGYSLLQCVGFSLQWLLLLQSTGSRCVGFSSCSTGALERRLSSCGAWA